MAYSVTPLARSKKREAGTTERIRSIYPARSADGAPVLGRSHTRIAIAPAAGLLVLLALFVGGSACGSKTSAPDAAAGAPGSAGSVNTDGCAQGETRLCIGPGACDGGQICESSQRWSPCDCGHNVEFGSAGSSGSATSSASGAGGAAGSGAGGASGPAGGTAGELASGGAEASAGEGGLTAGDEPCPAGAIAADCSGQCSSDPPASCSQECNKTVVVDSAPLGSVLLRLPSHPGMRCKCNELATAAAAYTVGVKIEHQPSVRYRVSVAAPWSALIPGYDSSCALPFVQACASYTPSTQFIAFTTSDPDAPSANVTIEAGLCP